MRLHMRPSGGITVKNKNYVVEVKSAQKITEEDVENAPGGGKGPVKLNTTSKIYTKHQRDSFLAGRQEVFLCALFYCPYSGSYVMIK